METQGKITVDEVEDYTFNEKQQEAYAALKKAIAKCEAAGLYLLGKSDALNAYPKEFKMMVNVRDGITSVSEIRCPYLSGAKITDCGADDYEFFENKFIE